MPGTFPTSHLTQFRLKYLQVKSNFVLSSKADNTIAISISNPFSFFCFVFETKVEAMLQESTVEGNNQKTEEKRFQNLRAHNLS